ncbi:MAG: PAS domain S-box protein, partial [Spirochaetota bacterium]|nr:PAS domain S-box protein [Spirochaetota bacterium]
NQDKIPGSVAQYVARTKDFIILENAELDTRFSRDSYVRSQKPKSILCCPITYQNNLTAILYLENNSGTGMFTTDHKEIINFFLSHVAIALENATLYQELKQSESRLRSVVHNIPAPIAITKRVTTEILYVNDLLSAISGLPPDQLIGRNASDFYADPKERDALMAVVKRDGSVRDHEIRFLDSNNKVLWISLSLQPFVYNDEDCFIAILKDISSRIYTEGELRQSEKNLMETIGDLIFEIKEREKLELELVRLTSTIHSSLKNKLESSRGFIGHCMNAIPPSNKEAHRYLDVVDKLVTHASSVSRNILFVITNKQCSVKTLFTELEFRARLGLSIFNIPFEIVMDNPSEDIIIKPDGVQFILEVYTELLSNIAKHSHATKVSITMIYKDHHLELMVEDNGIGFNMLEIKDKQHSYGLNILEELSQILNENFSIQTSPGEGTKAKVIIKNIDEQSFSKKTITQSPLIDDFNTLAVDGDEPLMGKPGQNP